MRQLRLGFLLGHARLAGAGGYGRCLTLLALVDGLLQFLACSLGAAFFKRAAHGHVGLRQPEVLQAIQVLCDAKLQQRALPHQGALAFERLLGGRGVFQLPDLFLQRLALRLGRAPAHVGRLDGVHQNLGHPLVAVEVSVRAGLHALFLAHGFRGGGFGFCLLFAQLLEARFDSGVTACRAVLDAVLQAVDTLQ